MLVHKPQKMKHFQFLSTEDRVRIICLSDEGYTAREVAKKIGCNHSTVIRLVKKYEEYESVADRPRSGRPRKTSFRQDRILRRLSLSQRHQTSPQLLQQWSSDEGVQVSPRTVRGRLLEFGLRGCKAVKKPLLTKFQRNRRVQWAKEHRHWTPEMWDNVLFSDEAQFCISGNHCSAFVRRFPHEKYRPSCLLPTVKHPIKIMVWGCMSSRGVGRLEIIKGTVNAETYIDILRRRMLTSAADIFYATGGNFNFQDDNAPCHRAKKVQEWLQNNGINRISWPGQSPDLNPIENLWSKVAYEIEKQRPVTKTELIEALIKAWNHIISKDLLEALVHSMPKRCAEVIRSKGWPTKY